MTDYEQIHNLLVRYCYVTDRGSAEDIAELFWEDGCVDFNGSVNHGIVDMKTGFEKWIKKMRDPVVDLRHLLYAPAIEINGNIATAEAYYDADGHSRRKGRVIQLRGVYRDELEKRSSEWRFLKRQVLIFRSLLDQGQSSQLAD